MVYHIVTANRNPPNSLAKIIQMNCFQYKITTYCLYILFQNFIIYTKTNIIRMLIYIPLEITFSMGTSRWKLSNEFVTIIIIIIIVINLLSTLSIHKYRMWLLGMLCVEVNFSFMFPSHNSLNGTVDYNQTVQQLYVDASTPWHPRGTLHISPISDRIASCSPLSSIYFFRSSIRASV